MDYQKADTINDEDKIKKFFMNEQNRFSKTDNDQKSMKSQKFPDHQVSDASNNIKCYCIKTAGYHQHFPPSHLDKDAFLKDESVFFQNIVSSSYFPNFQNFLIFRQKTSQLR